MLPIQYVDIKMTTTVNDTTQNFIQKGIYIYLSGFLYLSSNTRSMLAPFIGLLCLSDRDSP